MNLPKSEISRSEALELWAKERSDYAMEQMILSNQGLVGKVLKSVNLSIFDEDLFMTGIVGLIKAVNTFNTDSGNSFSTYAIPVIRNEILLTRRKKRIIPDISLDEKISLKDGSEGDISDIMSDGKDIECEIIAEMSFLQSLEKMNERERNVLYFLQNGERQNDIAKKLGITQTTVSKILKRARKKYKELINGG